MSGAKWILVVGWLALPCLIAHGGEVIPLFERSKVEFDFPIGGVAQSVKFEYRNRNPYSFSIVEVRPSCGCMVSSFVKTVVQEGASGQIGVEIIPGKFGPGASKEILVVTDDPKQRFITLEVVARARIPVSLSKPYLFWSLSGDLEVQALNISSLAGYDVRQIHVADCAPGFASSLQGSAREGWRLYVRPTAKVQQDSSRVILACMIGTVAVKVPVELFVY